MYITLLQDWQDQKICGLATTNHTVKKEHKNNHEIASQYPVNKTRINTPRSTR